MSRCGDSHIFIPLISLTLVLVAGIAMTGFATAGNTGTALTEAASTGQTDVVKDLLDKGADVNERGACGSERGVTALWCAAQGGHIEVVKVLVERGADVNARSTTGWTPLAVAASMRRVNVARFLVAKGADIEAAMAIMKQTRKMSGYKMLERLADWKKEWASTQTVTPEVKPKTDVRAEAPVSKPIDAVKPPHVRAPQVQTPVPPTVKTEVKPKTEVRAEAPASKPVDAVKAPQVQAPQVQPPVTPTVTTEVKPKTEVRAEAPASKPVDAVKAPQVQPPAPPTVKTEVKPRTEVRAEAPVSKPVDAVKAPQVQAPQVQPPVPPTVKTEVKPKTEVRPETPESRQVDAVTAAQVKAAADPMNWRALNALGIALYQARRYSSAAGAFEQAIAVFPIATAAETEQQAKEARQRAFDAQQAAVKEAQAQQKKAHREMQNQQILSGLLGVIPYMPGAAANPNILPTSLLGQTLVNAGMAPSPEASLPGLPMEEEPSQVLRTRELAALHTNLGLTRMALREDDTAIEAFRQAYALDASRVDLLLMQARLLQGSDVGTALPLYMRYLDVALEARQPETWIEIAGVYRRTGLQSERNNALAAARKAWDRLVGQSNPTTERAFGRMLSTAGFYKEALNPLQTWIRSSPEDAAGQYEWAIALFGAGRMEEAREAMKRFISAVKSAPSDDGGFTTYFLGMAELHLGHIDEAKKVLGTLHPSSERKTTSGFIAAAHALCGHVDEEKEWINQVETGRSDPDAAVADCYRLGWVWLVAGDRVRAAECISRSLDLQPEFGPSLKLQEQILKGNAECVKSARTEAAHAADVTSAIQRLSGVLSDMPMGPLWMALAREGMAYVAKLQAPLRMPREAQKHFLRAQAILKNANRPNEIREALGEYRWALRYAPLSPDIHLHLSSVCAAQKQFSQALRHIEICLAGFPPSEKLDTIIGRYYELQYLEERAQRTIHAIRPETAAQ